MVIELLYHKNKHLVRFSLYITLGSLIFIGLFFLIPNIYYNWVLVLPVFLFSLYHLYEWGRLSSVLQVDIQPEKIGLISKGSTKWFEKKKIQRTSLYYSTIDKPIASATLCIDFIDGYGVRIPGFPEVDKWIDKIY